ncbi:MAG: hypothetical protein ABR562_05565 [Thermoplasmatota archaeon]|nr:hypothetical protein [Halobacteriales archaeon]
MPDPKIIRADVTLQTKTEQKWGDTWSPRAAEPYTVRRVVLHARMSYAGPRNFDVRHHVGRLVHALDPEASNARLEADAQEDAIEEDGKQFFFQARAIFSVEEDNALAVVEKAKEYADQLRHGHYAPPTITVEQSAEFSRLGIKLRGDGIFGYARKCAREGCDNAGGSDDCFGSLDPAEAILGARKRDLCVCGTECWLDAPDFGQDPTAEYLTEWLNGSNQLDARAALMAAGCTELDEDEEEGADVETARLQLVPDWWQKAKAFPDARQVCIDAANEAMEGGDWDGNEDAIECEL